MIPVHSILKTFQGEGINIGKPAILLRVMGCNFTCPFCDVSDSSWNMNKNLIKHLDAEQINKLINNDETKHITLLLITGGEPTLYMKNDKYLIEWRKIINAWINYNEDRINNAVIDIETNGSFEYYEQLPKLLDIPDSHKRLQVNISPKLFEVSFRKIKNVKNFDDIVGYYKDRLNRRNRNAWKFEYLFKFVLDPYNKKNIERIERLIETLDIPRRRVYILPLTPDVNTEDFNEKFIDIQKKVLNYCIENGFTFIPRLHIYMYHIFDKKYFEYHKIT